MGVKKLYWHAGSWRGAEGRWVPTARTGLPAGQMPGITLVPVFRLTPGAENPLTQAAVAELGKTIRAVGQEKGLSEAQVDFDCPDRLLPAYAVFLRALRPAVAPLRLSATALAAWSERSDFAELQAGADELFPMFYDLQADLPAEVRHGRVRPILQVVETARQIEAWSACRIPWHAGLPGFARVTVFDPQGNSRGHLRAWSWDSIVFLPALRTAGAPGAGVTLLRAETPCYAGQTPIAAGETVACRWPMREDLLSAMDQARKAGAAGVAIFRLPEGTASGGWSLPQWGELIRGAEASAPTLRLSRDEEALVLTNISQADLPPRISGSGGSLDRGWQVEIEAGGVAGFREAAAGEFAAVYGHVHPDQEAQMSAPIPLAERLTFWFANLTVGESRRTGLIQLAPGIDFKSVRWRIPGSPQNSAWQPLP